MIVKEWIEGLRAAGIGLYDAMDSLDRCARWAGYEGPALYHILCDVYSDWEYPRERKRRYVKSQHTTEEWQAKKDQYGHRCFYCGKKRSQLTKDHIIPISKGGSDKIDNIVPACMTCNRFKSNKPIETFKNGVMLKLL